MDEVARVLDPVEATLDKPVLVGLEVLDFAGLFFAVLKADLSLDGSARRIAKDRNKPTRENFSLYHKATALR